MMAASKPTSWLFTQLHILQTTWLKLGTLDGDLGCFPLDYEAYPPQSDSCDTVLWYLEFDSFWYPCRDPLTIRALPPYTN